ncbi:unnamed protein product [Closterium sp. Naga37s-1]|nr:unnamed protein product [Closterium sp. Naga37s-1]
MTEWMAELLLLGRLKHPNLVNLIGYCSQKNQAMLVYALMPHGGLDTWLLQDSPRPVLTWQQRIRIALGAAQGLAYLHGSNIIHRDLKSCNILLDQVCLVNWVGGSSECAAGGDWGQLRAAQGLAYLHGSNIIHRDLKSCNILLDQTDNFGLSACTFLPYLPCPSLLSHVPPPLPPLQHIPARLTSFPYSHTSLLYPPRPPTTPPSAHAR